MGLMPQLEEGLAASRVWSTTPGMVALVYGKALVPLVILAASEWQESSLLSGSHYSGQLLQKVRDSVAVTN